jgi:hypothetical protein
MRFLVLFLGAVFLGLFGLSPVVPQDQSPPKGPYLGQDPPGLEPKIFAPGLVSTADVTEFSCTISRDGKEFYFTREAAATQFTIFFTKETADGWTVPALAPFSGDFFNHEPYIPPDGNKIYWGSMRPMPDGKSSYAIWIADRMNGGWGSPRPLGFYAMYVTSSRNGTLYYTDRGKGGACLARAIPENGQYKREILEEPLLSDYWDGHPCIAPDESYLIFDSEDRPESDECGLFISFKEDDGSWTEPVNMKRVISQGRFAMLSPDGKYLFFSAPGRGEGKDIYWVDAKIVDMFR